MGLDMYAFATKHPIPPTADSDAEMGTGDLEHRQIAYWRKHPNLHGYMEDLYYAKGGKAESFNVVAVRVDAEDLDNLEAVVKADNLPYTEGFFFGASAPEDKELDLKFIEDARAAIANGENVFYTSWW